MELIFQEGNFLVKTLNTPEELEASFRLRHEVFCGELKWVPPSPDGMEKDAYDGFAQNIGVFNEMNQLVGNIRLIRADYPFMIEKEFAFLMPKGANIRKGPDIAEVTRLCVRKLNRFNQAGPNIAHLLYKGLYQWNLNNGIRYSWMVIEKKSYRHLRLTGLPVEALDNKFLTMPGGIKAAICTLDWCRFEDIAGDKKPELLEWMRDVVFPLTERAAIYGC